MKSKRATSPDRTVGIMACPRSGNPPLPEKNYFRQLSTIGHRQGLTVFVFFPHRLDWERRRVVGYAYSEAGKRWEKRFFPLPDLVYDRCFYSSRGLYSAYREPIRRLMASPDIRFLGHGLKGKWSVHQLLQRDEALGSHLPATGLLRDADDLTRWLDERGQLFLKPHGGSHGKGVLHIAAAPDGAYDVKGRSERNERIRLRFSRLNRLLPWVERFTAGRKYVIQQYLTLTTDNDEPFDIRSLVQKNGSGCWELTGMAVRLGEPGSVTSNLHGGGRAVEAEPFLAMRYGDEAPGIEASIRELSMRIPEVLEQYHGRLVELGVDFGVDADGRLWVLEVNSKPGRSAFGALPNRRIKVASIRNPIEYARYLLDGPGRRLVR